jgi:hypothetical protein
LSTTFSGEAEDDIDAGSALATTFLEVAVAEDYGDACDTFKDDDVLFRQRCVR